MNDHGKGLGVFGSSIGNGNGNNRQNGRESEGGFNNGSSDRDDNNIDKVSQLEISEKEDMIDEEYGEKSSTNKNITTASSFSNGKVKNDGNKRTVKLKSSTRRQSGRGGSSSRRKKTHEERAAERRRRLGLDDTDSRESGGGGGESSSSTTARTSGMLGQENDGEHFFTQRNRFSGFTGEADNNADSVLNSVSALNALLASHGTGGEPNWLSAGRNSFNNNNNSSSNDMDHGDLWGVGDETEERMQEIIHASYNANRRNVDCETAPMTEEDEQKMLEQAIQRSLEEQNDTSSKQGAMVPDSVVEAGQGVDDPLIQQAINASMQSEEERALFDDTILQVQVDTLFESYSDDVVAETMSIFDDMKQEYLNNGRKGVVPTVDYALGKALDSERKRKQKEEELLAIKLQFSSLSDSYPQDILEEAEKIYIEMQNSQQESGGRTPTVEFAISLAQDRAKAEQREKEEKRIAEELRVLEEKKKQEEQVLQQRSQETREQRAARFAAAFEKKKQSSSS